MTYQPHLIIKLKSYISQPQLFSPSVRFCHRYDLSFILALTWIQPSQPISTSFLWRRSLTYHWAVANQAGMLEHKFIERLLADQCLSDLVVVEWEGLPQTLQKKATGEEPWLVARETANRTRWAWLSGRQHQLQPRRVTKQWA